MVETGLAFSAHLHMLFSYWIDVFNTVVYVINRVTPHNVGLKSPGSYSSIGQQIMLLSVFLVVVIFIGFDLIIITKWNIALKYMFLLDIFKS